jgi:hypothetical protein
MDILSKSDDTTVRSDSHPRDNDIQAVLSPGSHYIDNMRKLMAPPRIQTLSLETSIPKQCSLTGVTISVTCES